jgi:hypothetical protein
MRADLQFMNNLRPESPLQHHQEQYQQYLQRRGGARSTPGKDISEAGLSLRVSDWLHGPTLVVNDLVS